MEPKPWYASKTMWANIIAGVATVGTLFWPSLKDVLTPETQVAVVGGVMAVVNIVLRATTKAPIGGQQG